MPLSLLQTPCYEREVASACSVKGRGGKLGERAVNEVRIGLIAPAGWARCVTSCPWCSARSRAAGSRDGCRRQSRLGRGGARSGLARRTGEVVADPRVDVVDITAPNDVHREIALAALAAGKPVYCEKPLANSAVETKEMAGRGGGRRAHPGRLQLPEEPGASVCARADRRGRTRRDYAVSRRVRSGPASDPDFPFTWRHERAVAGSGALGDMGRDHAAFVAVPDRRRRRGVQHVRDVHPRAAARGERHRPERARRGGRVPAARSRTTISPSFCCALRTARSARSATSRGTGRKMGLTYEIQGIKGALSSPRSA